MASIAGSKGGVHCQKEAKKLKLKEVIKKKKKKKVNLLTIIIKNIKIIKNKHEQKN
jgi:hypothetical protein